MAKNDEISLFTRDNPFTPENLDLIFQIDGANPNRILTSESTRLDFKQTFNKNNIISYARTFASFANTEGGYIVFGVNNETRTLVGIDQAYGKVAPEDIVEKLNSIFSPEIKWNIIEHKIDDKSFALIYIRESEIKPIIAKREGEKISSGDIFYRYGATTSNIQFPELQKIIQEQQNRFLEFIQQAIHIGVDNAMLLDLSRGKIQGRGTTIVVDEKLLQQIKFIQTGTFRDTGEYPTLRLIGDIDGFTGAPTGVIQPIEKIDYPIAITPSDIITAFLNQENVKNPLEYIKIICNSQAKLPIFYFMQLENLSVGAIVEFISKQDWNLSECRQEILKKRLNSNPEDSSMPIHEESKNYAKVYKYLTLIGDKELIIDIINEDEFNYVCKAILRLEKEKIQKDFLFPLVHSLFEKYKSNKKRASIRQIIAYLDRIYYAPI